MFDNNTLESVKSGLPRCHLFLIQARRIEGLDSHIGLTGFEYRILNLVSEGLEKVVREGGHLHNTFTWLRGDWDCYLYGAGCGREARKSLH